MYPEKGAKTKNYKRQQADRERTAEERRHDRALRRAREQIESGDCIVLGCDKDGYAHTPERSARRLAAASSRFRLDDFGEPVPLSKPVPHLGAPYVTPAVCTHASTDRSTVDWRVGARPIAAFHKTKRGREEVAHMLGYVRADTLTLEPYAWVVRCASCPPTDAQGWEPLTSCPAEVSECEQCHEYLT